MISLSSEIDERKFRVFLSSLPSSLLALYINLGIRMVIYSIDGFFIVAQETQGLRRLIFDELTKIVDPEINVSIMELELIDNIDINGSSVKVDIHLTSPFCPAIFGFKIAQDIHDNLLKIDGVDDVKLNISNHFMAEAINNQVNASPNPKKP